MRTTVTFGTTDLTATYLVTNVQRPLGVRTIGLVDIPGRDGQALGNVTYDTVEISMDVIIMGGTHEERSDSMRNLAAILSSREPVKLAFSDDGSKYYMAVPNGGEIQRYIDADYISAVTFTCPDPAMFGEIKSETMDSDSITIEVEGNYPTKPTITCAKATNGDGNVWGVRLDNQDFVHMALSTSDVKASIDCENRVAMEGSRHSLITLDSDWLVLDPGEHTITLDQGTGYPTITWQERWV